MAIGTNAAPVTDVTIGHPLLGQPRRIAGDDSVGIVQLAENDALLTRTAKAQATATAGSVARNRAVGKLSNPVDVETAAVPVGSVAADGAIREHECSLASDVNSAAFADGRVSTDRAIDERDHARQILDAAPGLTFKVRINATRSAVILDGTVDERQGPIVHDTAPAATVIVADDDPLKRQRAFIRDAPTRLRTLGRIAMPDRQRAT